MRRTTCHCRFVTCPVATTYITYPGTRCYFAVWFSAGDKENAARHDATRVWLLRLRTLRSFAFPFTGSVAVVVHDVTFDLPPAADDLPIHTGLPFDVALRSAPVPPITSQPAVGPACYHRAVCHSPRVPAVQFTLDYRLRLSRYGSCRLVLPCRLFCYRSGLFRYRTLVPTVGYPFAAG